MIENEEAINYGFGFLGGATTIIIHNLLIFFYDKFCKRSDVYGFDEL